MMSSSPEYAITKPGMPHHLLRKREKPLRTYGKRSTPTPELRGEPPAKKARFESDAQVQICRGPLVAPREQPQPLTPDPSPQPESEPLPSTEALHITEKAPRSSILNYFKPVLTEPKTKVAEEEKMKSPDKPLSATTVTPTAPTRRKPRLLRIRATSLPSDISSEDAASITSRDETDSNFSSPDAKRKGLHEVEGNALNQTRSGDKVIDMNKRKRLRSKRSPTVQTTLNISSQAAYSECKTCGILYNPLYPDDVKYHEKWHKTVTIYNTKRKLDDL
ncbi:hypothetical protein QQS21_010721 [Conoideocrella luteorostrata]|uniref:N-acetyltransferase ESCO zinc-finger domain-containing protein n=1 Tax=Conoideocrella luteorostrata TaxID=1105319 RepID=A0AAJ0CH66_9HYPO|nr:hypothetical protein QQS21_010721 [Conoideocrella luteorostrata]